MMKGALCTTLLLTYYISSGYSISHHVTPPKNPCQKKKKKSSAISSIEKTDAFKRQCSMQIAWNSPGVQAGIAIAWDICNFSMHYV